MLTPDMEKWRQADLKALRAVVNKVTHTMDSVKQRAYALTMQGAYAKAVEIIDRLDELDIEIAGEVYVTEARGTADTQEASQK